MTTVRLYLDEDSMDTIVIRALRERGLDVLTPSEAGMEQKEDPDQLSYAMSQGRVICTFNVGDFYRMHTEYLRASKSHAGIVLVQQQRYWLGELIGRLSNITTTMSPEAMENRVEFLSDWEPE